MTARAWRDASGGAAARVDAWLAGVLFATIMLYLAALPLNLSVPDEGHALISAKRIAAGEVMYRDIFDLTTPGWPYLMAGVFSVFGTTLAAARLTAAVIHACTAVLVFLCCRRLDVRRGIAWACGLAYLVLCQPLFPVASYHWLATFLCVLLLVLCLGASDAPSRAFVLGIVVGLLIAVHQRRGLAMGVGVAALFVAQAVVRWRYGQGFGGAIVRRQMGSLASGALLIVAPLLTALVASAGFHRVWDALVVFPLVNYRTAHNVPWGFEFGVGRRPQSPVAIFLAWLPTVAVIPAGRLLALTWREQAYGRARALMALVVLSAFAMLSITYYPDVVHIAFIAPFFLVILAESAEWALRRLPTAVHRPLGAAVAALLILATSWRWRDSAVRLRGMYPVAYESAFGRIDLPNQRQAHLFDQLRAVLDAAPSRALYCYPTANYTHLVVDAENPTRFAYAYPGSPLTSAEQMEEIVQALAATRPPYIVTGGQITRAEDRIARYVREHYEKAPAPRPLASVLWRRKSETAPDDDGGS